MTARGCPLFFILLVVVAWGTLFIPMPKWLSIVFNCAFVGIGLVFVIFGWAGVTWDSHMQPGAVQAKWGLVTGVLLLLSRGKSVIWLVMKIFTATPMP
jgi:hypothetical protein